MEFHEISLPNVHLLGIDQGEVGIECEPQVRSRCHTRLHQMFPLLSSFRDIPVLLECEVAFALEHFDRSKAMDGDEDAFAEEICRFERLARDHRFYGEWMPFTWLVTRTMLFGCIERSQAARTFPVGRPGVIAAVAGAWLPRRWHGGFEFMRFSFMQHINGMPRP